MRVFNLNTVGLLGISVICLYGRMLKPSWALFFQILASSSLCSKW